LNSVCSAAADVAAPPAEAATATAAAETPNVSYISLMNAVKSKTDIALTAAKISLFETAI